MRNETRAERRERIATALLAEMVNDQSIDWWESASLAIEGADAMIELLDAVAEADTKGEGQTCDA